MWYLESERTWAWLAVAGWGLFGALAMVGRALLQLARTGSTGVTSFRSVKERVYGSLFGAGCSLAMVAPALSLVGLAPAAPALASESARLCGAAGFLLGTMGTLWAQLVMGSSWRIGVDPRERTGLVTTGPFRLVRNPIFSFLLVCAVSGVLIVPSAVSVLAALLVLLAVELQVRQIEEPYLVRTHGEAYLAWAARVGRFLPGIGRGVSHAAARAQTPPALGPQ